MTYPETIKYLESFINYEKIPAYPYKESLKLERVKGFLAAIGNPQDSLKCIHIAGTKGKGSTCAFLTYILRQAGFKVGLYTSPHLSDFRERIRILSHKSQVTSHKLSREFEGMISQKEISDLVARLRPAIEDYNRNSKYERLSFFEVYTALAFVYFKEKKVDFAVLETGLGGRLDATNVVNPLVAVITPISYEHTQKLGNTLKEIAQEKAGIIKPQVPIVISAPQEKEAGKVIRQRCKDAGAKLYEIKQNKYPRFKIKLLGEHQQINANVAAQAARALGSCGIKISEKTIQKGLCQTVWPGRLEIVAREPLVVLDGAQNVASAVALKKAVQDNFKYKELILVLGISSDKDIKGVCRQLCPLADKIILTRANNPRATKVDELEKIIKSQTRCQVPQIIMTENAREAMNKARGIAHKEDLVLVTGSLFVVGEARKLLKKLD
ncbi:MAG: bifunctional folylpolyglutamate synthase/dihydrofolate synthase [Candidatus Omnitrophica bacterium]|nr:bifunctional folylpolyglutamate synthase/dihydrofolate synthase [Candidatus Omnitrophota bacterium]